MNNRRGRIHFIGICGKAMGAIAVALARGGWRVTGSSELCYDPMHSYLDACGIGILSPHQPSNVAHDTDCVIVGKRIPADNPELQHVLRNGIRWRSFPEFLRENFLVHSRNAVVAGGLGKTTTTSMLCWILEHAGLAPDYLVGGMARNFAHPARFEGSEVTVLEGDEYASSFEDPRPKFLHYQPELAIVTNIVEDHPDLYADLDAVALAFARLIDLIPEHGCLIVPDRDPVAMDLAASARCPVQSVGRDSTASARITDENYFPDQSSFRLLDTSFEIPLCGIMNVSNAAMAALAATHFGVSPGQSAAALQMFRGVRNRQEERRIGDCTLVLDKATHPLALEALAQALRQRYPGRRLISLIQPRATGGRDWVYQRELPRVLSAFDRIILARAYEHAPQHRPAWTDTPFSIERLASALAALGVGATVLDTSDQMTEAIRLIFGSDDVLVVSVLEQSLALIETIENSLGDRRAGSDEVMLAD